MATINKRGPFQFQAIIRRKGYPSQTKTFESRSDAEAWVRSIESKMDDNTFRDRRDLKNWTLFDALERYVTEVTPTKRGHVQERNRLRQLQRHPIALRNFESLQAKDFSAYRNERLKEVGANAVRLELALLSHLYTIAIKEWSLPLTHEINNIRKPSPGEGRDRRLRGDEFERLVAAIQRTTENKAGLWLQACIRLALETGMRAGEILTCQWRQVDLDSSCIRLETTKNGSRRTVPLSAEAVRVLKSLPKAGIEVIGAFHNTANLSAAFSRACVNAGISNLKFHDLRHEAASRFAPHMKVQDLAKIMGWKTLQMAMRYYNPTDNELVQLIRRAEQAANTGYARLAA